MVFGFVHALLTNIHKLSVHKVWHLFRCSSNCSHSDVMRAVTPVSTEPLRSKRLVEMHTYSGVDNAIVLGLAHERFFVSMTTNGITTLSAAA